jgi:RNA polymerase sigma factor (sigma-70 family)
MTQASNERLPTLTAKQQELMMKEGLPLVERAARKAWLRYKGRVELEELMGTGRLVLSRVLLEYEETLGVPFEGYAWMPIYGAMLNAAKQELRLSGGAIDGATRFSGAQRDEGDVFNDSVEDKRAQLRAFTDGCLSAMFCGVVGQATREGAGRDERAVVEGAEYARAIVALREALRRIRELGPTLIRRCYMEGLTLKQVGPMLGMSYANVRRFHNKVLARLGVHLRAMGVTAAPEVRV